VSGSVAHTGFASTAAVTAIRLTPISELLWYPYTARKGTRVLRLLRLLLAHDWSRRLSLRRRWATRPQDQAEGEDHEKLSLRQ
jgi:hypothetical protein